MRDLSALAEKLFGPEFAGRFLFSHPNAKSYGIVRRNCADIPAQELVAECLRTKMLPSRVSFHDL
jgi:hypothetical protein